MRLRFFGSLGIALSAVMDFVASVPQARAAAYQIDLSISYNTVADAGVAAGSMSGQAQFFLGTTSPIGGLTDIANLSLGSTLSKMLGVYPPCSQLSCDTVGFSFSGFTQGFGTDAFGSGDVIPSSRPALPSIIALANLQPGDRCFSGGTER